MEKLEQYEFDADFIVPEGARVFYFCEDDWFVFSIYTEKQEEIPEFLP